MYRPLAVALCVIITASATTALACSSIEAHPASEASDNTSGIHAAAATLAVTTATTAPAAISKRSADVPEHMHGHGHKHTHKHLHEREQLSAPAHPNKAAAGGNGTNDHMSQSPGRMPSDRLGRIPVLEYHVIGDRDGLYSRTREHFREDLEDVYRRGYRPVNLAQVLDRNFSDIPPGMSPVVIVFDDASPGQFSYIDRDGRLDIDPASGIGIWLDFAKSHPGWKNRAVFCLLNGGEAGHNFFGDKEKFNGQKNEWRFRKVKWLADNGFELCDHTVWHAMLNKYSDAVVQEQIARNAMAIDSAVPGYRIRTMALPYGIWPRNKPLAWEGSWRDPRSGKLHTYHFDAVLEVAGGPTRSPYDPKFDPHHITRIQAVGNNIRTTLDQMDRAKSRFVW